MANEVIPTNTVQSYMIVIQMQRLYDGEWGHLLSDDLRGKSHLILDERFAAIRRSVIGVEASVNRRALLHNV